MIVDFDPVIFSIGPLAVRWYGLMYVVAFMVGGWICSKLSEQGFFKVPKEAVDKLITMDLICMFIGARFFYVFFYNWSYYSKHLSEIPAVWKGGLSFHGALCGFLVAGYLFAKKYKITWAEVMDVTALAGAQGLLWGRIGNFINGELYGRITDSGFGLIFKGGGPFKRHPSQLYEGFLEGFLLTIILWSLKSRVKIHGYIASTFLLGYGLFRYLVEFFREPDEQVGYFFSGTTTLGQIFCLIMILVSFVGFYYSKKLADPINQTKA